MCVVATPGQGKTDTLLCIRYDRALRQELIKKINECQQHVTCLHVVPLFATFNAGSSYDEDDESDFIQAALCHRLLLDYVGNDSNAFKFDSRITPRFANLKLRNLLTFVQAKESGLRGCAPSQICVIFLVDEVMKVGSELRKLCNAFTFTQCSAMPCGQLCFSVVTCLQVDPIYDAITAGFGCPLHSIPLLPCSAKDTNNFLNELFLKCTTLVVQDKQFIHWLAHACNGHFRSLAQLWSFVVEQGQPPPEGPISSVSSACILEIIANHLAAPKFEGWVKESTEVGALFSASRKASTIHDIVFSGEGVRYRDVWPGNVTRMQRPVVLPCVSPLLLTRRIPCDEDTAVAQNIVKILPQIFQRLHMPNELPVKTWEIAIPLLEAVAVTMIREVSRGEPVALKDVMKGVVVQHWKTRQIELQYTSTCETCYTSWVEPSDEVKTSVLEDDEALKVACASKSATLCTANTATYPGLEGVHTMLEATSAQGVPIPVVFQMKTWEVVEWNNVEKWIAEGHKRAQEILELKEGEYFVALYITQSAQQDWKHKIPEGTIVIDQPVLELLLSPFGTSTLLQLVQQKEKDPTSIKRVNDDSKSSKKKTISTKRIFSA
ncbi:Hypothetical protein, putative [Bodo saltans]|uniref:Uncharacterized protein n=1 Tax=Bodo saltans TaxID=75058 RepID=A0A0S4J3N5_BODSA|nr:Hypothetical protein, putative [Bodo saltans]|eukprot:CUG08731.1 Hypothetical protein, putative [Bodo saltans]